MNLRSFVTFAALVVGVAGCGDDGGQATDAPPGGDAPPADAALHDAPPGGICGGNSGATCPSAQYCDFARNGCGAADETGVCTDRPIGCPDTASDLVFQPTCGCDGVVYGGACDAYAAGTDLNANGTCTPDAGQFWCGWSECSLTTQYCQRAISDIGGEPDGYQCMPLPGCPSSLATCACLIDEPCGGNCSGDGAAGLTLTCPGG